ncbi:MAG TPA: ROK family protein [Candidatus Saccharimonadales bacterium]|nr:ROK family protein [Candidatus Saccharimonadales bacterium]
MILAIDIGGTKTLVALFGDNQYMIKSRKIATTPDYYQFLQQLTDLIQQDFAQPEIKAVGIAAPGLIDYTTHEVTKLGNLLWHDIDLVEYLHQLLHVPVFIDNDANVAGLAEAHSLEKIPHNLLYVTFGTGIGSGIITEGRIDPTFAHSEVGHMMLWHNGLLQRWEDIASGRAILRDYHQRAADITDVATWKEIAHKMALGFFAFLAILQPDVVVVGGGIGTYFDRYGHLLSDELRAGLPALVALPPIIQAKHPEEAVIYGCYQLAEQALVV